MTTTFHLGLVALLLTAIMFVIPAVVLLRRGFFPRRVGTTPHCARCEYNLTGLTSERCPECGANLIAGNIVHGEQRQTRGRAIGGILCLLPVLACLMAIVPQINWYQYRPAGWLLSDLAAASPSTNNRAWTELMRRDKAGGLSDARRSELVDLCLKEQAVPTAGPLTSNMVDFAGRLLLADELSASQKDLFLKQAVILSLTVRPTVILGDSLPYQVGHSGRGPSGATMWVRSEDESVAIDDQIVRQGNTGSSAWSGFGGGSSGSSIQVRSPGKHTITIKQRIEIHTGPFGQESAGGLLHETVVPLTAPFEVLPAAPEGYVKSIADSGLTDALRDCIKPTDFRYKTDRQPRLEGTLEISKPPVNIAFEVIFRINDREYNAGSIHKIKGESTHWGVSKSWWDPREKPPADPFTTCDVILRGSEKAARGTVDLFEFWDGELVYKDVPVTVKAPATQASRPGEAE